MIVAEFNIIPLGTETPSVSRYVKVALGALKSSGVKVESGAMGTVIEANSVKEVFGAVEKAHDAVFRAGAKRVMSELKIDDRRDKNISIESKLRAIE